MILQTTFYTYICVCVNIWLALKLHIVLTILELLLCASMYRIRTFKITYVDPNKKYASDLRMPGISQT